MTIQERITDIANRCGLSEEIVKAVQKAEIDSAVSSLRKGEVAQFAGRCRVKPVVVVGLGNGDANSVNKYVKLKATPSKTLETRLKELDDFEEGLDKTMYKIPNILVDQIDGLV